MSEPTGLRGLLNQATPGPWHVHRFEDDGHEYADVRPEDAQTIVCFGEDCYLPPMEASNLSLIALAPEMAALLCDMAAYLRDNVCDPDCKACAPGHALLARFAALDGKAGRP